MNKLVKYIQKLTLFDKIVLFGVFFIGLVFLYVFFRKQTFIDIVVKVGDNDIQFSDWQSQTGTRVWFNELFHVGMQERDGLGRVSSEVTKVWSYDTTPPRKALYLNLKVKVVYNKSSNQYTYKGNPVLIGYPIKLFLDKTYVQGLITDISGKEDPRVYETLLIDTKLTEENLLYSETNGVKEHIANAINEGDVVKDSNGQIVLKVVKKIVEDAKKIVTTSNGSVIVQKQPFRKDVYLTLEVRASKTDNRYYMFDDVPLLVGYGVPINTSNLAIYPEIIKMKVK